MKSKALFTLFAFLAVVAFAECGRGKNIDEKNFEAQVISSEKVWVLKYASKFCGSCKEFEPTWNKLMNEMNGQVEFGVVSIDDKAGQSLAASHGAMDEGIPNVKVFASHVPETIVKGDPIPLKKLKTKVTEALAGCEKKGKMHLKLE